MERRTIARDCVTVVAPRPLQMVLGWAQPPSAGGRALRSRQPRSALVPAASQEAFCALWASCGLPEPARTRLAGTPTAEGHPTNRGGQWASATVTRILGRLAAWTLASA